MTRARLLDLTRSLRRAGRMPTGIDRVERAYLRQFLAGEVPVFGLMRTPLGYLLLDREGLERFQAKLDTDEAWGAVDRLSRLPFARDEVVQRVESDARRLSVARAVPMGLKRVLRQQTGGSFDYYNVGHSNLTQRVFESARAAGGTTHVMVHDVIPMDHPQFQRPETVPKFEQKLRLTGRFADRVIYNSRDTARRSAVWFKRWGPLPSSVVAPLGVDKVLPDPAEMPPGLYPDDPYFIAVGTIEPRKNHGFLLDLWETPGPDKPLLLICGSRGWNNAEVFARLDTLAEDARIKEVSGLSDAALAALIQGAKGMLFPSLAEGYGLPPVEALRLGTRVLCNDLPVLREVLGDHAHFAPVSDTKLWLKTVNDWTISSGAESSDGVFDPPTWADHFEIVLGKG